jgi:lipopolysaccharide export system permease protein
VVLIQFVELTSQVGTRADVGPNSIFELTLLRVPAIIQILLPICFLFGGIGAFVVLNRRSEAGGHARGRRLGVAVHPALGGRCRCLLGVFAVGGLNPLAATLSAKFELERARIMENYLGDQPRDIWLRQGDDTSQIVIHAKARDTKKRRGDAARRLAVHHEKNRRGTAGIPPPAGGGARPG